MIDDPWNFSTTAVKIDALGGPCGVKESVGDESGLVVLEIRPSLSVGSHMQLCVSLLLQGTGIAGRIGRLIFKRVNPS